jgi:hypothetical protein
MLGGPNSASVCVTPGSYTISGSGCQDLGHYNEYAIASITTPSSGAGVTINFTVTCTSGNGWFHGDVYYELNP